MERLYSIREIRTLLGWSSKTAFRVFEAEPGVLPVKSKRGYFPTNSNWRLFAPRVPESVLLRVRRRLQEEEAHRERVRLAKAAALQDQTSSSVEANTTREPTPAPTHFSIAQIAQAHNMPAKTALRLFDNEPGVLPAVRPLYGNKTNARFYSPRVPREILDRVIQKNYRESRAKR